MLFYIYSLYIVLCRSVPLLRVLLKPTFRQTQDGIGVIACNVPGVFGLYLIHYLDCIIRPVIEARRKGFERIARQLFDVGLDLFVDCVGHLSKIIAMMNRIAIAASTPNQHIFTTTHEMSSAVCIT